MLNSRFQRKGPQAMNVPLYQRIFAGGWWFHRMDIVGTVWGRRVSSSFAEGRTNSIDAGKVLINEMREWISYRAAKLPALTSLNYGVSDISPPDVWYAIIAYQTSSGEMWVVPNYWWLLCRCWCLLFLHKRYQALYIYLFFYYINQAVKPQLVTNNCLIL